MGTTFNQKLKAASLAAWDSVWDHRFLLMSFGLRRWKKALVKGLSARRSGMDRFFAWRFQRPINARRGHVLREEIVPPPEVKEPMVVRYVIQEHNARRAGLHHDLRIWMAGRGVSFAIPKGLPKTAGDNRLAILQPDHTLKYFEFEGEIEEGYGQGTVKIIDQGNMEILHSETGHIHFEILEGENSGIYKIIPTGIKNNLVRKVDPNITGVDKHRSVMVGTRADEIEDRVEKAVRRGQVLEAKVDGSHSAIEWDKKGRVEIYSWRKSVTGDDIRYTNKLVALRSALDKEGSCLQAQDDCIEDTILHGEVWHPKGPSFLAGILNSLPWRARLTQQRDGDIRVMVFDAKRWLGKDVQDLSYEEITEILSDAERRIGSPLFTAPERWVPDPSETPEESYASAKLFLWRILNGSVPVDGLVAKNPKGQYQQFPLGKIKPTNSIDARIIGFREGLGKFDNSLGSIQILTPDGRIVTAGTGWSHREGKWIWDHRDRLLGDSVEVNCHDRIGSPVTGCRYMRFHPSKSSATALSMYADLGLE